MKVKLNLYFRRFNGPKEDEDSGYYSAIDSKKVCRIDVNLDDEPFEQALTIYHEITHFLFDMYTQHEIDNAAQKVNKRDKTLKEDWRVYNDKVRKSRKDKQYKEELICGQVEKAVKTVLQKQIPKAFFDRLFTNKKKQRIIPNKKKRRK